MKNVLISGVSSGLGEALTQEYLNAGWRVFGFSRRQAKIQHKNFKFVTADLQQMVSLPGLMFELLAEVEQLDLVVLNAGVLGEISLMSDVKMDDLKTTMDINVWANKVVLDYLCKHICRVSQVVAISSGAAVNANKGWCGYAISKAALNSLIQLYAHENVDTHYAAFAPGLIDTSMQDYLCSRQDVDEFPSLQRIQSARSTMSMPSAVELAVRLPLVFDQLKSYERGCFVDLRKM